MAGCPFCHSGPQTFPNRTPCEDPKSESESDLCAQWKSANAAEDSAFWTKWGFWVAVIGSSLLLWQIALTREAVKDTGDATKAMVRANEIAEAAQRAWIIVEPKIANAAYEKKGLNIRWECDFRNIGKTVAADVKLSAALKIYHPSNTRAETLFASCEAKERRPTNIIPGEAITGGAGENYRLVDAIQHIEAEKEVSILLVATAKYRTSTDDEWHFTKRAYAVTVGERWFSLLDTDYKNFTTERAKFMPMGEYTIST